MTTLKTVVWQTNIFTPYPSPMCETKAMLTLYFTATAVFSIVTGGALRDDTKNGCVAD